MTSFDRPSRFLAWAHETFGDIALDPQERTMRFVEEAVELAHAMGVDAATAKAVVDRVFSRPAGDVSREVGQCVCTLELLSKAMNVDANHLADAEFARVQCIPKEEWARRHSAKVALGIAR